MKTLTLDELRTACPAAFATEPDPAVSARYQFQSTISLITPLLDADWRIFTASQRGSGVHAEHRLSLLPPGVNLALRASVGDLRPVVHLFNSHDRSKPLTLQCGIFRCVCSNQLFVPTPGGVACYSAFHLRGHLRPAELAHVLSQFAPITESIHRMESHLIEDESVILTYAQRALMHVQNMPDPVFVRYDEYAPLVDDLSRPTTAWSLFNHLQSRLVERGRRGRPITAVRRNATLNTLLWADAERLTINV